MGEKGSSKYLKTGEGWVQAEGGFWESKPMNRWGVLRGTVSSVSVEGSEMEESGIEPRQDTEGKEAGGRRDGGMNGHGGGASSRDRGLV